MDNRYLRFIPIGPPMQLSQLTTPPLVEEAQTILQRHGCTFKEHPEGCINDRLRDISFLHYSPE